MSCVRKVEKFLSEVGSNSAHITEGFKKRIGSSIDRVSARKFEPKFDVIAFEQGSFTRKSDVIEYMFDVIVNQVKKYSPNAGKFEAKAG